MRKNSVSPLFNNSALIKSVAPFRVSALIHLISFLITFEYGAFYLFIGQSMQRTHFEPSKIRHQIHYKCIFKLELMWFQIQTRQSPSWIKINGAANFTSSEFTVAQTKTMNKHTTFVYKNSQIDIRCLCIVWMSMYSCVYSIEYK